MGAAWLVREVTGLSPGKTPSAASGHLTARCGRALTGGVGAGSGPATDCLQLDVAVKGRTAGEIANPSIWPVVLWLSPYRYAATR